MGPYVAASIGAVGLRVGGVARDDRLEIGVRRGVRSLGIGADGAFRTLSITNSGRLWFSVDPVDTS